MCALLGGAGRCVCVVFLFLNKWVLWSACVDAVLPNIGFGVPVYFSIFTDCVTLCVCVCVCKWKCEAVCFKNTVDEADCDGSSEYLLL